tara:strand:- start:81 stop:1439 length:1359 start_codon:yes stop_codon:yes gene_type:complete
MNLQNKKISIVGGGLVGSLLSIYLKKQGALVSVFDKRSDIRKDLNISGRSINLALSDRGIRALKKIGLSNEVMKIAMPMYNRMIHSVEGELTIQNYGTEGQSIFSISRKELNAKLIDIAERSHVGFYFNQECQDINFDTSTLSFSNSKNFKSDFIFGADGAGSVVRKMMNKSFDDMEMNESYINHGYKELTIPCGFGGKHKLVKDSLHIWPRKSFMVIALPNLDGSFTCTLFAPLKGSNSFGSLLNKTDVDQFFSKYFDDLHQLIPDLSCQYFNNPTSSLGFVRCSTWKKKNTILIGDACHATVPFYGQGMNAGFEDCFLLNQWLDTYHDLTCNSFYDFLDKRIQNTCAMQDLSMDNYIEMRDKTANNFFLTQKKIEQWFSSIYPEKWLPLYSMVTFSHIDYSLAIKMGKVQDKIMKKIMKNNNITSSFDVVEMEQKNIDKKILKELKNLPL